MWPWRTDLDIAGNPQHNVGVLGKRFLRPGIVFLIPVPISQRMKHNGVPVWQGDDRLVSVGGEVFLRHASGTHRQLVGNEAVRNEERLVGRLMKDDAPNGSCVAHESAVDDRSDNRFPGGLVAGVADPEFTPADQWDFIVLIERAEIERPQEIRMQIVFILEIIVRLSRNIIVDERLVEGDAGIRTHGGNRIDLLRARDGDLARGPRVRHAEFVVGVPQRPRSGQRRGALRDRHCAGVVLRLGTENRMPLGPWKLLAKTYVSVLQCNIYIPFTLIESRVLPGLRADAIQ